MDFFKVIVLNSFPEMLAEIKKHLNGSGKNVCLTDSPEEAYRAAEDYPSSVFFMSTSSVGWNGLEVAQKIRNKSELATILLYGCTKNANGFVNGTIQRGEDGKLLTVVAEVISFIIKTGKSDLGLLEMRFKEVVLAKRKHSNKKDGQLCLFE